ncbi:hypothetical protein [Corynebacterium crudilactis]|uniref:PBP domain-containing protein n=1 Tax=Corynebacterium crudilactis TaxID=1652495 RepID=A0A172QTA6_9CORY|nr:hypothetical protein [Corynebacterium crudilactis]ANE03935.1 hypothetical protein ccrud_06720 [Corynebacterium crudilactis]
MNSSPDNSQSTRGRGFSVLIGILLLVIAVLAVLVGRGNIGIPSFGQSKDLTEIRAVIGSEKKEFFDDPEVQEAFAAHGFEVKVDTAGSRRIATDVNLSAYDFAFPSSAPAAQKIAEENTNTDRFTPFHSPMAVATFKPISDMLGSRGIVTNSTIDLEQLLSETQAGTRWSELSPNYPSNRVVQISTTDVRTSNSAAMYLSMLAWVKNDGKTVGNIAEVDAMIPELSQLFVGQGYTESTSAGPFDEYLSQGMGAKPLVMIYEAQFLAEQNKDNSRITADMELLYPSPTVYSTHTVVSLSEAGAEVGALLENDENLQRLAVKHGFRPKNAALIAEEGMSDRMPSALNIIDPPDYDFLERLIDGVGASYSAAPTEEDTDL